MRRDTLANWSANNPTLAEGEMGLEKDTNRWKIGNGSDAWNSLPYSNSIFSGSSTITDDSAGNALRITQLGSGNALIVEDSANPDNTPFVIDGIGNVGIGTASPSALLEVNGLANFIGIVYAPTASVDTNTTQVATTQYVINQDYLKNSSASSTYLDQISASTIYLDKASASITYLDKTSASTTYLTQVSASTTYLDKTSASTTYLDKVSASTTYAILDSPIFTGSPTVPDPTISSAIANKKYVDTIIINNQLDSYTLALTDAGKLIEMDSSNSNTVTIPLESSVNFDIGTSIDVYQYGSGQTTIIGEVGVTVRSSGNKLNLTAQYSAATLVKRAANDWVIMGDLS